MSGAITPLPYTFPWRGVWLQTKTTSSLPFLCTIREVCTKTLFLNAFIITFLIQTYITAKMMSEPLIFFKKKYINFYTDVNRMTVK